MRPGVGVGETVDLAAPAARDVAVRGVAAVARWCRHASWFLIWV